MMSALACRTHARPDLIRYVTTVATVATQKQLLVPVGNRLEIYDPPRKGFGIYDPPPTY